MQARGLATVRIIKSHPAENSFGYQKLYFAGCFFASLYKKSGFEKVFYSSDLSRGGI